MNALVVLAWALGGLALLVASFLATTLRTSVRIDGVAVRARAGLGIVEASFAFPERTLEVRVWRFRMLRRRLDGSARGSSRTPKREREASDAPRRRTVRSTTWLGKVRTARAYRRIVRDVVRRVEIETCEGHLRIATPDPALTGMAYGLAQGARSMLPEPHRSHVTVEADFVDDLPHGRASVALRVRVAVLALAAWRVFWFERGRSRRGTRLAVAPGRSDHATNRTARGAGQAGS